MKTYTDRQKACIKALKDALLDGIGIISDESAANVLRYLESTSPVAGFSEATAVAQGATLTDDRVAAIADETVNAWANTGRMPQMAWDFRGLVADGVRRASAAPTPVADSGASAVPTDLLPNALWTRRGSGTCEWWTYKGYEARKDSADQWVLRKGGKELYRHTYLQVVMAHAEREILAAAKPVSVDAGGMTLHADMFWPEDDGEQMYHSLDDAVTAVFEDSGAEAGQEFEFTCAARLPKAKVRIIEVTENGFEWEEVTPPTESTGEPQ